MKTQEFVDQLKAVFGNNSHACERIDRFMKDKAVLAINTVDVHIAHNRFDKYCSEDEAIYMLNHFQKDNDHYLLIETFEDDFKRNIQDGFEMADDGINYNDENYKNREYVSHENLTDWLDAQQEPILH